MSEVLPVRVSDPWEGRLADMRRMVAICDEANEILTRTNRLVDRICPLPNLPDSSRWNVGRAPSIEEVMAHQAARRRRNHLHSEIRQRITAKVRRYNREGV